MIQTILKSILKIILLTFLLYVIWTISALIAGLGESSQPEEDANAVMIILAFVCLLHVLALSYPIIRSGWYGWRLIGSIFLIYFGVMTVLTQIETIVFLKYLTQHVSDEMIPKFILHGFLQTLLFSPVAVIVLGKFKPPAEFVPAGPQHQVSCSRWILKFSLVGIIYVFIYFLFGVAVFQPLAGPAFQEYYGNIQPGWWIFPLQFGRGLLFGLLGWLVIRMMKGAWWEAALAIGFILSFIMASGLLIPNPFMSPVIRQAHLVEVASSNFLFGLITGWILRRPFEAAETVQTA